jgi:hypothetical protein
MDESQTAPWRIAPRPVRKKYCPDKIELRHGVQLGAVTNAFLNSTPCRAMPSMTGVLSTWLIDGRFSTVA